VLVFIGIVAVSRMVALGSVLVALSYPVLVLVLYPGSLPIKVTVFALAALVIWRHRTNIVRIVRGEENKLSFSRRGAARSDEAESSDKEQ